MSTVLLVNDDPYELTQLEYQLVSLSSSIRLLALTDPVAAMMRMRNEAFDMLFVNYRMSVVDGLSLVRIGRKIHPDMCVNIMCNQADAIYIRSQSIYRSCDNVLLKPCDIHEIEHIFQQHSRLQSLSRENKKLAARLSALEKHSGLPLSQVNAR